MDNTTATALANEARRQELRSRVARLQGNAEQQGILASLINRTNSDTLRSLQSAQAELAALEQGAGPGLSADFGEYSTVDQLLRTERFAGKAAVVDLVQGAEDPSTVQESDAVATWTAAGLAATGRAALLQDPAGLAQLYREQLVAAGAVPDTTWESQRAWIKATPKDTIMGL